MPPLWRLIPSFVASRKIAKKANWGGSWEHVPAPAAAGAGRRAMRMAVVTGDSLCAFGTISFPRSAPCHESPGHATLHIEFDTEQPTETMPDAGSPAHLFLYAASAYAIYNLVSSTMRDPLSWHLQPTGRRSGKGGRAAPGG